MVNLINYQHDYLGLCMETVWRVIRLGGFMVKLVWRLSGVFMEKTSYKTISILTLP